MCECNNNCSSCNNRDSAPNPERRRFLGLAVGLINGIVGIAVVGPVIGFIGAPLFNRIRGKWVPVMPTGELADNETKEVTYAMTVKDGYQTVEHKYGVYLRREGDKVFAFDPTCTHLGCRVKFQGDKGRYFCPCHGGVFDANGKVVSGPPPEPLKQYQTKIEGGQVWLYREV
jgi:Rieske Fe-S protein